MRTPVRIGNLAVLAAGLTALAGRPAPAQAPADAKPAAGVKSVIKVTVPQDNTELQIEDKATAATGRLRAFETPPLDPAQKGYTYKFTAKWKPNNYTDMTRTKEVTFKAGDEVAVDLTKDDPGDKATIRFVPTPDDVVAEMIKLAGVGKDDVVYEPGCGDARIAVAAVKAGARRGVGIDIDPDRVDEAKASVKAAKVGDKVDIRLGDALDIKDLSDATVVFLYMGNEFDLLIRPVLWKQLKPGTRVVSHRFLMGDWKPEKTVTVQGLDGDEYLLHKWTITPDLKDKAGKK